MLVIVCSDLHLGKGKFLKNGQLNILEDFFEDERFKEFCEFFSSGKYYWAEVHLVLNGDILNLIQRIKREVPEDLTGKNTSQKLLKSIFRDIKTCGTCYVEYRAGDKFCSNCSNPVKTFGTCPNAQCGKVHSGGKFCQHCGTGLKVSKARKKR